MRSAETERISGAASAIAARVSRRHFVLESCRKLGRPQHPQRVLCEALGRQNVDPSRADVRLAAVRIYQLARRKRPSEHIHAKVTPGEVLLERHVRAAMHLEIPMADTDRALAAGEGDVDGLAVEGQLQHGK